MFAGSRRHWGFIAPAKVGVGFGADGLEANVGDLVGIDGLGSWFDLTAAGFAWC